MNEFSIKENLKYHTGATNIAFTDTGATIRLFGSMETDDEKKIERVHRKEIRECFKSMYIPVKIELLEIDDYDFVYQLAFKKDHVS
jgi:hypothetical protein